MPAILYAIETVKVLLAQTLRHAAFLLLATVAALPAQAETCSGDPKPVIYVRNASASAESGFSIGTLNTVSAVVGNAVIHALAGPGATVLTEDTVQALLSRAELQMQVGADTVGNSILLNTIDTFSTVNWTVQVSLGRISNVRSIELRLLDMARGGIIVRSRAATLPDTGLADFVGAEARAFVAGLDCLLRSLQGKPVQPQVRLAVEPRPPRGQPGGTLTVKATLVDLAFNALPTPNRLITFQYLTPQGQTLSRAWRTNADGVATDTLELGAAHPRAGLIEARFVEDTGRVRKSQQINYYVQPAGGQLKLSTGKAQLVPAAGDTVSALLQINGGAVAAAALNLSASAGAVASAAAVTNSAGQASVPYTAPAAPTLVDVRATATLPAGAGTAEAKVSYVVDPGVVMGLKAGGDTVILGASSVSVDLEREQQAVAGATVAFSVAGGGTLTSAAATTDSVGRAEVVFAAPSRPGASTISARVTLDGQTYTRSVTVRYSDALDAITRELIATKEALYLDASDANLMRLERLRGVLQARGEGGRYETLLGDNLVGGQLSCLQQRAHGECAAGALARAEPTLTLLKTLTRGSSVLAFVFDRARDSLRVCPYTPFVNGSVYVPAATIDDIVFTHTVGLFFSIGNWGPDDRPSHFFFNARDETGTINRFVYGGVPVSGAGPSYSGTINDGDTFNLWGNRFLLLDYQRNATAPTVSISINGAQVSGSFALYRGDYEGVGKTATVSFSTTVTLPAAPEATMCNHRTLPQPEGDGAPPGPATRR